MMEIAELTTDDTLKLPAEVAGRFQRSDRFLVLADGDALYLKRIAPRSVPEIVAKAPPGEPMSMEEINEAVHLIRRQRQTE